MLINSQASFFLINFAAPNFKSKQTPMKNRFTRTIVLLIVCLSLSTRLLAQFDISGEFRMRGEYRDGYMALRDSSKTPYATILGRARLLFDYNTDKISTRFSLYDAWVFGQNNYSSDTIGKNTVNVYEAWFKYNFSKYFSAKAGRMELVYDDERFLGMSNWSMWGATHDAVVAQWQAPKAYYRGDFGVAINNLAPATAYLSSYNLKNNYKYMTFLYEQEKFFHEKLTISFLALVDCFQKSSTSSISSKTTHDTLIIRNSHDSIIGTTVTSTVTKTTNTLDYPGTQYARATVGADATLNLKNLTVFLTGYYQGGHYKDGRKINANFYAAAISYQIVKPFRLLVGYDHLSGNDYSDTAAYRTTVKGFSCLYGTAHRLYGYMDLFNSLSKDNLSTGLNDLYARGTVSLNEKMSIEATWRWFSLPHGFLSVDNPGKGQNPYTSVSKSLGHEVDLMYSWKPLPNFEFNAAYCFFLPTSTMELQQKLKSGTSEWAQYAYVMVTYKPTFFSTGKK